MSVRKKKPIPARRVLDRKPAGSMTDLLAAAIAKASALDPGEQDALACLIQDEMKSEAKWQRAFARSEKKLAAMGDEALAEHRRGESRPLSLRDFETPAAKRAELEELAGALAHAPLVRPEDPKIGGSIRRRKGVGRVHGGGDATDPLDREIDFRGAVRGKYSKRYMEGTNVVLLDRDVAAKFKTSEAVNTALRKLLESVPRRSRRK